MQIHPGQQPGCCFDHITVKYCLPDISYIKVSFTFNTTRYGGEQRTEHQGPAVNGR